MIEINLLAILAATVAAIVIGFVWYSQQVFGKAWMRMCGIREDQISEGMKTMHWSVLGAAFSAFVMGYVVAHFVAMLDIDTWGEITNFSFWSWLGFVATSHSGYVTWERKPMGYYAINAGYYLPTIFVITAIIARWPW